MHKHTVTQADSLCAIHNIQVKTKQNHHLHYGTGTVYSGSIGSFSVILAKTPAHFPFLLLLSDRERLSETTILVSSLSGVTGSLSWHVPSC